MLPTPVTYLFQRVPHDKSIIVETRYQIREVELIHKTTKLDLSRQLSAIETFRVAEKETISGSRNFNLYSSLA